MQIDLKDISSEIVSTVEGAFGLGIEYDDIVEIIIDLLIEKFPIEEDPEDWMDGVHPLTN